MPAQYGGRLSSVLDIKMNDGNNQDFACKRWNWSYRFTIKYEKALCKKTSPPFWYLPGEPMQMYFLS